jgi:oxygen-dependent protoporphyrinogen oxidase
VGLSCPGATATGRADVLAWGDRQGPKQCRAPTGKSLSTALLDRRRAIQGSPPKQAVKQWHETSCYNVDTHSWTSGSSPMPRIVIVGAGISGLALAYRLRQRSPQSEITILERQPRPGGTIWTERSEGFQIEIGPNGFLDNKPSTLSLCRDLGLHDRLLAASEDAGRNRYLFYQGKLRRLPNSLLAFLGSDLLSWRGKLSVLAERFRPARRDAPDETIAAFASRRAGKEAAEILADALVTGIHAGDPALLSARAAMPRLVALEEEHGSVMKGMARAARARRVRGEPTPGRMWSFREGLRLMIEALRDHFSNSLHIGVAVRRVERTAPPPGWLVQGEGQERWPADAVVLTCPAPEQADILESQDADLARRIRDIPYSRVAVVALGYRRADVPGALAGFGYIAPQRTRRDLLGVQWCSSIFPERAPPGLVLLRAMCGGWNRSDVVGWDDVRLLQAVRAELRLAMAIEAEPVFHRIIRWERAIPQYQLGHLERVAWIRERTGGHAGLFLGGNAYDGIALNDCTEQAEVLAESIKDYLGKALERE